MNEINIVYCFFVVDFTHFASRRKIINHHLVVDCKSWDTQMGFPRPSRNVVIDSISPLFVCHALLLLVPQVFSRTLVSKCFVFELL